jgi:hypothetical protein
MGRVNVSLRDKLLDEINEAAKEEGDRSERNHSGCTRRILAGKTTKASVAVV